MATLTWMKARWSSCTSTSHRMMKEGGSVEPLGGHVITSSALLWRSVGLPLRVDKPSSALALAVRRHDLKERHASTRRRPLSVVPHDGIGLFQAAGAVIWASDVREVAGTISSSTPTVFAAACCCGPSRKILTATKRIFSIIRRLQGRRVLVQRPGTIEKLLVLLGLLRQDARG